MCKLRATLTVTLLILVNEATDVDGGIEYMKNEVIPGLRQQKGYRGISISGDRAGGVLNILAHASVVSEADRDQYRRCRTRAG